MYYEPCDEEDKTSDVRVDRPFDQWPVETLRPRAITRADLQTALLAMKAAVTEDDLRQYQDWSEKYGATSV